MKFKSRQPNGQPISRASNLQYRYVCGATNLPEPLLRACAFVYDKRENPYDMFSIAGAIKDGIKPLDRISESLLKHYKNNVSKLTAIVIPVLKNHIDEGLITYDDVDEIWKDSTTNFKKIAAEYIEANFRAPVDPEWLVWNGEKLSDMMKRYPSNRSKTEDWPPWSEVEGQISNIGYGDNAAEELKKKAEEAQKDFERMEEDVDHSLGEAKKRFEEAQEDFDSGKEMTDEQIEEAKKRLEKAKEAFEMEKEMTDMTLEEAKERLEEAQEDFDSGKEMTDMTLEEAKKNLEEAEEELQMTEEMADTSELENAKKKAEKAKEDFENMKEMADISLENAKKKAEKAKEDFEIENIHPKLARFDDFLSWIYYALTKSREFQTKQGKIFYVLADFGKGITITPRDSGKPRKMTDQDLEKFFDISKKEGVPGCFELKPYEPEQTGFGIRTASYYPVILEYYVNGNEPKSSSANEIENVDPRVVGLCLFNILKNDDGFSITEIEKTIGRSHEGKKEEQGVRDKKVWHNKTEVDEKIQHMLGLDQAQVEKEYPGGRKIFYQIVALQVRNLRQKDILTDWDEPHRSGIWRITARGKATKEEDVGKILDNYYLWSVSPENWTIIRDGHGYQGQTIGRVHHWGSKLTHEKLNEKLIFGKFIFYVKGKNGAGKIKGIYQSEGEWYKPKFPLWVEDFGSLENMQNGIYRERSWWKEGFPSRIDLKPLKTGSFDIFDPENAKQLSFIPTPKDKTRIAVSLRPGGKGMPSNFGKSMSITDYELISKNMTSDPDGGGTLKPEKDDYAPPDKEPEMEEFDDEQIPNLTKEEIDEGIKKIQEKLWVDPTTINEIVVNLIAGKPILLVGPVGTGKTELARMIPEILWKKHEGYFSEIYTATADWTTHDVIGGIVPKMVGKDIGYKIENGCITHGVLENWNQKQSRRNYSIKKSYVDESEKRFRGVWIVIDEFNRADIDKAFGQIFTSIETKNLKIPTNREEDFDNLKIPNDFRIIGTLNSADKHTLFHLSDALKRRFAIIQVGMPPVSAREDEIEYAVNNAFSEIKHVTTPAESTLTKINLYRNLPYDILRFVRYVKPLGTAMLKSIYQTLLVSNSVTGSDITDSLDIALTNNLSPQLESLDKEFLDILREIVVEGGNPIQVLRDKETDKILRAEYAESFGAFLDYLGFDEGQIKQRMQQFHANDSVFEAEASDGKDGTFLKEIKDAYDSSFWSAQNMYQRKFAASIDEIIKTLI